MKNYKLLICEVDRHIFDEIANGRKSIETRAATEKYRSVSAGDTFTFVCGTDTLVKTVASAAHYASLKELYSHYPVSQVFPSAANVNEAIRIHLSFPGYKEKLAANGIMAFELAGTQP